MIKAHALVDFVVDCTRTFKDKNHKVNKEDAGGVWTVIVDRSCGEQGEGAKLILVSLEVVEIPYTLRFKLQQTIRPTTKPSPND